MSKPNFLRRVACFFALAQVIEARRTRMYFLRPRSLDKTKSLMLPSATLTL